MLAIFKTCPEGLAEIDIEKDEIESGSWFNLIRPTAHELRLVSEITQVELDALRAALDQEEASRIEAEDEYILVLTNIPKKGEDNPYGNDTIPLGIIVTPKFIITVCLEENGVLSDFNPMGNSSTCFTVRYSHCTPRVLFDFSTVFLGICWLLLSCRILLQSSKLTTEHAGKGRRYCGNITSNNDRVNTS